ncbi:MAG: alpha/beta hydrolase [Proteobacteria bacterium]|nr:alpha/beta hydrolase [Pseudomonadota bacterium]
MLRDPDIVDIHCKNPEGSEGTHRISLCKWGNPEHTKKAFCVHGLTRNARDFDYLASELMREYQVFAPDMPGRGKSEWLKEPAWYNYGIYVGDVLQIFAAEKFTQVDFIGTSMGGIIGMMIAANFPQTIRKLVINDIGPFIPKDALLRIAQYAGVQPHFTDMAKAKQYYADVYTPWNLEKPEHLEHMIAHGIVHAKGGGFTTHYDPNIAFTLKDKDGKPFVEKDVDLWEMWEKVQCPVLLLRGQESDLFPREVALEMQKRHGNLTLIEYAHTGHAPSLMRESQVAEVKNWLSL